MSKLYKGDLFYWQWIQIILQALTINREGIDKFSTIIRWGIKDQEFGIDNKIPEIPVYA